VRVLVVEDDPAISLPLRGTLEAEGYAVCVCERGSQGLDMAKAWDPNVVLLDLQLPDTDGLSVTREMRSFTAAPIIMVTGRGDVREKVAGLDAGANDYVVKPFNSAELLARIRAVMRGATPSIPRDTVVIGDLTLDLVNEIATKAGEPLALTRKEFEILRLLASRAGDIVRRDELARAIWGTSPSRGAPSLHVHMSWLRRKLGDDATQPRYIENVRGAGYRLKVGSGSTN
jgi:DNA-binding response OmpR family regulator